MGTKNFATFLEVPILNSEYPKGNEARKARHLQRFSLSHRSRWEKPG